LSRTQVIKIVLAIRQKRVITHLMQLTEHGSTRNTRNNRHAARTVLYVQNRNLARRQQLSRTSDSQGLTTFDIELHEANMRILSVTAAVSSGNKKGGYDVTKCVHVEE
jgi:hypothetical protein